MTLHELITEYDNFEFIEQHDVGRDEFMAFIDNDIQGGKIRGELITGERNRWRDLAFITTLLRYYDKNRLLREFPLNLLIRYINNLISELTSKTFKQVEENERASLRRNLIEVNNTLRLIDGDIIKGIDIHRYFISSSKDV